MHRWMRRLVVIAITTATSVLTFWILLRVYRPNWETREYPAIVGWSLPLGLLVLGAAALERRWVSRRHPLARMAAAIILAADCAILWLYIAVALTGGYALAFDSNPLWCWASGSFVGMLVSVLWPLQPIRSSPRAEAAV